MGNGDNNKLENFACFPDWDELLKDAGEATDMNNVIKNIMNYFNSNEYLVEKNIELGKNYNNLMHQVVGAEKD